MNRHSVAILALTFATSAIAFSARAADVKNIVIVQGALADGSGWRKASDIFVQRGFKVTMVQERLTSLADDIAATHRVLDLQDGPTLLVGHTGGMVITEAGHSPDVAGLGYATAFQPDKGESLLGLASSRPASSINIRETKDGNYLFIDPTAFADDFAGDMPRDDAAFMARLQVFASKDAFSATVGEPAWKTKKSWSIVATQDRSINPDLERQMVKRAGSTVAEIKSSHLVFASQPEKVADVIERAAKAL